MECIVIGGGIIGMLTARELALAGCRVRIIERGALGGGASWAGGGILSPLYPWRVPAAVSQLAFWSQLRYPELADELYAQTGVDPEWERSGLLMLDTEEAGRAQEWAAREHVAVDLMEDPQRIASLAPACRSAERALWFPEVAQIRNPRLIRALSIELVRCGIDLIEHAAVTAIECRDGRIAGVRAEGKVFGADAVVVAAGAWSARILETADIRLDVEPVRGQMLLYRGSRVDIKRILLDRGYYVIPRRDGRVLVGSTVEEVGFDQSTTPGARDELRIVGESLVPSLAHCEIERHWAGLRPGSAFEIPYICPVPGIQGLYINTGHYRNGLLLAPASARLMTDLVLERRGAFDSSSYGLSR